MQGVTIERMGDRICPECYKATRSADQPFCSGECCDTFTNRDGLYDCRYCPVCDAVQPITLGFTFLRDSDGGVHDWYEAPKCADCGTPVLEDGELPAGMVLAA